MSRPLRPRDVVNMPDGVTAGLVFYLIDDTTGARRRHELGNLTVMPILDDPEVATLFVTAAIIATRERAPGDWRLMTGDEVSETLRGSANSRIMEDGRASLRPGSPQGDRDAGRPQGAFRDPKTLSRRAKRRARRV